MIVRGLSRALPLVLSALLAAACDSVSPAEPSGTDAAPPVVVVLGDSLTAGPGLDRDETYPAVLQRMAREASYPHRFYNAGVSGDTTTGARARLAAALDMNPRVLVVALGANDGLRGVPVATVRDNLAAIVETAQGRGIRVLLCGMETPPTRGWEYTIEFHRIFPALAERYHVPLMPFLLTGVVGNPDMNHADGWHPNAAGARRIAENMWPYLEPLLR